MQPAHLQQEVHNLIKVKQFLSEQGLTEPQQLECYLNATRNAAEL